MPSLALRSFVLALVEGGRPLDVLRDRFGWLGWHFVAYGLVAGVLDFAYEEVGLYGLVIAVVPVAVMRRTQATYVRRTAETAARLHSATSTIQHQNASLVETNRELRRRTEEALESLSAAVDARDAYTAGHSRRVQELAIAIGRELGLGEGELAEIGTAALLHDIGKLAVPDAVLLKPSILTADEWEVMRRHPEESARIVSRLGFLADIVPAIRHHHERYDGNGYPDRLAGADIPLGARIIHVADTIDAMQSPRTYRAAHSPELIHAELKDVSGAQLCPDCVDAACRVLVGHGGRFPGAIAVA